MRAQVKDLRRRLFAEDQWLYHMVRFDTDERLLQFIRDLKRIGWDPTPHEKFIKEARELCRQWLIP